MAQQKPLINIKALNEALHANCMDYHGLHEYCVFFGTSTGVQDVSGNAMCFQWSPAVFKFHLSEQLPGHRNILFIWEEGIFSEVFCMWKKMSCEHCYWHIRIYLKRMGFSLVPQTLFLGARGHRTDRQNDGQLRKGQRHQHFPPS